MKRWTAILLMAGLMAGRAWAGGWTETYSLSSGSVIITNSQVNSTWVPAALMWRFASPGTGTVEVSRVSQGVSFVLGSSVFTNVSSMVWVPEAPFPFGFGDALEIRCSVTNGVVQVIRKGE